MKYGHAYFRWLVAVFATTNSKKKNFYGRVVSHTQENVGSSLLSGEHMVIVVLVGFDKVTISMPQSSWYL